MRQPIKFGKYLLLERIAVGGMAEVYSAKAFGAAGFERLLAIKRILPTMGEDPEFIQMFVDEARIAAQLSHANIVQVIELGKHEDSYFIAMEYVSGRDVRQLNERFRKIGRPMPIPQACFILSRVCEALDYAHRKRDGHGVPLGIVHRDISPQNVLVSFDGNVKLIDFGIAKAESRFSKTQAGILKGKFSYMSPEQVKGHAVDHRSDIFATGVLLWEMLCGQKLFTGDSDIAVLEKVRAAEVAPPRTLNPSIPEGLEEVVLRSLAGDPRDRYQWASEMHDDLLRFTLQTGAPYGSRQLSEWLLDEYRGEREKEEARISRWLQVERRASEVTASIPGSVSRGAGGGGALSADLRRTEPGWHVATEAETIVQAATPAGTPRPTRRIELPPSRGAREGARSAAVPPPPPPSTPTPAPLQVEERTKADAPRPPVPPTQMLEAAASRAVPFDNRQDRTGALRKRRSGGLTRPSRPEEGWRGTRFLVVAGTAAAIALVAGLAIFLQQPAEKRPGKIVVTVSPAVDAELFVDGRSSGKVPPHLRSLAAGDHRIEVKAAGYRSFATTVSVRPGTRPVEIDAALEVEGGAPQAPGEGAQLHGSSAPR
ncbi:MAG: PEGA domain-containing protein [Deltaproteobacteria bacterium]|nr:MAG: PEGA domain-containing protein [Deltaproteobacteria bacterium]